MDRFRQRCKLSGDLCRSTRLFVLIREGQGEGEGEEKGEGKGGGERYLAYAFRPFGASVKSYYPSTALASGRRVGNRRGHGALLGFRSAK